MTAGKFAIHYFFSSYERQFKIISKNRLFYNHFYLFHLCCLYHDYRKKGFRASRCACGQFAKSYKTDGFLLKDSALCLIAVMHFQSGNVCDFVSMPFVVSVSEPIER